MSLSTIINEMKIGKGDGSADCDHFCPEIKQHILNLRKMKIII